MFEQEKKKIKIKIKKIRCEWYAMYINYGLSLYFTQVKGFYSSIVVLNADIE